MMKQSRGNFLTLCVMGFAVLAFSGCGNMSQQTPPVEKPNILFISVDDLNDWANCLNGREGVHTPNLDRLARRGVLFTNAHCSAPSCNPSRASIMTGVSPSTSGIYHNSQNWRASPALKEAMTIPEYFRSQGYRTIGTGKIFHALTWIKHAYGTQRNDPSIWDEYWPDANNPIPPDAWPASVKVSEKGYVTWTPIAGGDTENRPAFFFDFGPLPVEDEDMSDTKVVDWASEKLQQEYDQPFFFAVGIFRPHIPWFAPQKYFDLYPLEDVTLPKIIENDLADCSSVSYTFVRRQWQEWAVENDMWRPAIQGYLASISFFDAQLGRLIDALDRSPHADNTIIVLWSDHGMHIGEKEHWEKFTLWEESTRVPMLFVAPGVTQPDGRCNQPTSLLDVYPTLVELTGGRTFAQLEGRSLMPQLLNPRTPREEPAVTTWGRNNHAVRTDRWRYIHYHNGDEELYDHRNDPDEFVNLADRSQYEQLKKDLARWLPAVNVPGVKVTD